MIRFHNSLTRRIEPLETIEPGRAGLYTCGPTVHDYAHIGNFRAYVWEDLLRRHLESRGIEVLHVMNITDVEDKIIRKAGEAGVEIEELTGRFTEAFFEDVDTLGIARAHHYPKATDHVTEMIDLCRRLDERGHTYVSDGSVYFRIASFPSYGRLSGLERGDLKAGARVDSDEYGKDDPSDFVLWKAHREGEPRWDSPWGPGRPGWHLECSAMAIKYLGESFDIHTGGVDNKFPHHENEIAQSEGATGKPFVRTWLHCAHLVVEGEKMSKSLGNFHTLRDLIGKGHDARCLRHVLIGAHYRKHLNFTMQSLDQARAEIGRVDDVVSRLGREALDSEVAGPLTARVDEARTGFGACLDDDLNISGALGELFSLIRDANGALDRGEVTRADAAAFEAFLDDAHAVVGTLRPPAGQEGPVAGAEIEELVAQRERARADRDWAASDRLRDELAEKGWNIEDTPSGPRVRPRH